MRYNLSDDPRPRLGLIALQVDETLEDDFRRLIPRGDARLHVTRIPSGARLNADSIGQMAHDLPAAAALLPPAVTFDAVGYACTSGTTLIGAARVADLVSGACTTRAVTDPLTATLRAIRALGLQRIGILSPYVAPVADAMRAAFVDAGVAVPDGVSFGEEIEANVARIEPASTADAARALAARTALDGVFLSCTNLRTLDLIAPLESELGVPVLSSNLTLAWGMARLAALSVAVQCRLRKHASP